MYKFLIITICAILISAQSLSAQNFKVVSINTDLEVELLDKETGLEYIVVEGDKIESWTITEVMENKVVIMKDPEGDPPIAIMKTINFPEKIDIIPLPRQ
ncbi:MAG: hypothetical protein JW932_13105 [Deltaproteobacteria bacterium]|nr:hypothetical protein [Deltaproteobacteria bacterium]